VLAGKRIAARTEYVWAAFDLMGHSVVTILSLLIFVNVHEFLEDRGELLVDHNDNWWDGAYTCPHGNALQWRAVPVFFHSLKLDLENIL
jgi:hypothetical protein